MEPFLRRVLPRAIRLRPAELISLGMHQRLSPPPWSSVESIVQPNQRLLPKGESRSFRVLGSVSPMQPAIRGPPPDACAERRLSTVRGQPW